MKVLQVVKTSEGAAWAFDQADALIKRGIEVLTVMPDLTGKIAQRYQKCGYPLLEADFSLPLHKPWQFFARKKAICKIVEDFQPDLIHSHFVTNIVMLRLSLKNNHIPRVFQVPGPLHLESFLFRMLDIKTAKKNDYWIGTCEKTVSIYRENHIPESRLFLGYYGGYGGAQCDQYKQQGDTLRREFGIDKAQKIVGMVSYTYKPKWYAHQKRGIKGHEDFADAIALVRKSNPQVMAVVIGGPWGNSQKYFERMKAYAFSVCGDHIIFTGTRRDIKDIYCELDVVVHPSHSENLGGAAESLAAARPTISTDVGGFPDIVKDGETGCTVPKKNPEALANAICEMLNDEERANAMAQRGQTLVRNLLDIEVTSDVIVEIYQNILSQK